MRVRRAVALSLICLAVDATAMAAAATTEIERGVTATWNVRLQADGNWLQVIEEITIPSASNPPRAVANDRPFGIRLPPEAEVLAGAMQTGAAQAISVKPAPGDQEGEYYFPPPLLTGETRFAVGYRLPYRGRAVIRPGVSYPLKRIEVVLPDSMTFEAESPGLFEETPNQAWATVQETASAKPGQSAAFRVSGTGTLARVRGPKKPPVGQTAPSHAGRMAVSHGGPAVPEPPSYPVPADRRFLIAGLAAVLAAGSAVLLGYRRKQLRRLSA